MKFHHRWLDKVLVVIALVSSSLAHATAVPGQGTWETTLQGRDLDGNLATAEAYYDTALNITWLADADYFGGTYSWTTLNDAWAAGLNIHGITGWRLPATIDVGNNGCTYSNIYQGVDCGYNISTHSEMSHMYFVTLGNKAYYDTAGNPAQPGWGLTNTGPFFRVRPHNYWSATEYAPDTNLAWFFFFNIGLQSGDAGKSDPYRAWFVHSDDVGASVVPVPAAVWLFGSGLLGLAGIAQRRKVG